MKHLLQIDFPYHGPFGDDMTQQMAGLAHDIANEDGLLWKLWTYNEKTEEAGGVYLFENASDAHRYLLKHTERLKSFGYDTINAKIFCVNEALSAITKYPF